MKTRAMMTDDQRGTLVDVLSFVVTALQQGKQTALSLCVLGESLKSAADMLLLHRDLLSPEEGGKYGEIRNKVERNLYGKKH